MEIWVEMKTIPENGTKVNLEKAADIADEKDLPVHFQDYDTGRRYKVYPM